MRTWPLSQPATLLLVLGIVAVVVTARWHSMMANESSVEPDPAIAIASAREFGLPPPPPGAFQVLPPDAIRAIDRPEFVPVERAQVAPDSPMLVLQHRGETRAYSLRLLNHHEVVNDTVAGEPLAITW